MDTIKEVVEQVLREYPETREDDFLLCIRVYIRMGFAKNINNKIQIDLTNPSFEFRPAFETITRTRREIQNDEHRLQASDEVQVRRIEREAYFHTKYARANTFPNSKLMP